MNAKKIATSLPGPQYEALERMRKRLRLGRSEVVQQAIAMWLTARQGDARIVQYVQGYASQPDDPAEAAAFVATWAQGLEAEDW
jgi:metal-responsive CopG/Arc/MetJ family transcriptional regulator